MQFSAKFSTANGQDYCYHSPVSHGFILIGESCVLRIVCVDTSILAPEVLSFLQFVFQNIVEGFRATIEFIMNGFILNCSDKSRKIADPTKTLKTSC